MTAQPPPGDDIAALFEEGRRCFRKPDGLGAVRALEKVIDLDPAYRHPDGDNPYFYLGKINEVESRYKDAIALYSQALANDPWDEESLIGRGSCLSVTGQQDRAIADFEKVLAIPSKHRRAPVQHLLYAIAENYRQKNDYAAALHWGQQALEKEPDNFRHQELVKEMQARLMVGE
ncbi:MAG: tetratricopeptide repeat protein [Deltaproteobacteria bacterium]|nr:tetratricopeptide repeat protein [Deltaproteobacteria bacterium]